MLIYTLVAIGLAILVGFSLIKKKKKLPPGPPGLPFFGNVFQIDKTGHHKSITDWQKEYGDVFTIRMFGSDFVVLNSFDTIYESLVSKANDFAGRIPSYRMQILHNFCPDIAFCTFSRKWVFMKKLTMSTFKIYGNNLEYLESISVDLIHDMMEELEVEAKKDGAFDVEPFLHRCTTGIITSIIFGAKLKDSKVKELLDITKKRLPLVSNDGPQLALDLWPWLRFLPLRSLNKQLIKERNRTQHWFLSEIDAAKERYEPGNPKCLLDDFFDYQGTMVEKKMAFTLTDDDIFGIINNLIFAGTITTTIFLSVLIALWINKPWLQKKMADEVSSKIGQRTPTLKDRAVLTYTEAAILELLRYLSIFPLNIPHFTTTDTSVGGYEIPKGTRVFYNLWKLHHDPEFWDKPWEFKPERFLDEEGVVVAPNHPNRKRMMAFGAGHRRCPGETLGRNRLFLMIVSLLQRFEFLPESEERRPLHDPRDYINGLPIFPPKYNCQLSHRQHLI